MEIKEKVEITDIKSIEDAVSKGIRTTINRFREHPFLYFTESDIHSSLKTDIINGNSDLFYKFLIPEKKQLQISLVHLEYPTNFSFSRKKDNLNKRRGNSDIVILNPDFISTVNNENKVELLQGIIAKNYNKYKELHDHLGFSYGKELMYVIEVKFLHLQKSESIFEEIKIDNEKLKSAFKNGEHIRPINLIFCYYSNDSKRKEELENQEKILTSANENILILFIKASINPEGVKQTLKPFYAYNPKDSEPEWVKKIVKNYFTQSKSLTQDSDDLES